SPGHRLEDLALRFLGHQMIPLHSLIGEGESQRPVDAVPLEQIAPYAAEDAEVTLRLYYELMPRLEAMNMGPLMRDVEAPLALVLAEMEAHGILCDPGELQRQGEVLKERAEALRAAILDIVGYEFNL